MANRGVQIFCLGACLAFLLMGIGCGEKKTSSPPESRVKLHSHTWTVELATTAQQRYTGLSGRKKLPAGRGMLFVYPREQKLSFCMRGCEIPIDIAFLDRRLRVVNLYEMTVEPDRAGRTTYDSHVPVLYALELPGGTLKRAGVRVGDQAEWIGVPPADQAEPGR